LQQTRVAKGKTKSHLLSFNNYSNVLSVFSLPEFTKDRSFQVEVEFAKGHTLLGWAADPSGTALVTCEVFQRNTLVRVLPWPLPGTPVDFVT
jgi:hypothetical protein